MKRCLELDDLLEIEYLANPVLSPKGERAVYVMWKGEKETGKFFPRLYENSAPLLPNGSRQMLPTFSPDGKTLFYLSDKGKSPRVYQLWKLENGVETKLTALRHGIGWYSLSADGTKIAFEAPLWLEGTAPGDTRENALSPMTPEERISWQEEKDAQPIVIDELVYKMDSAYGIFDGSFCQIGMVDLLSQEVKLLTWEGIQHHLPVWSPDGTKIALWRYPKSGWGRTRGELTILELDGSFHQLTDGVFAIGEEPPLWLDSHTLAYANYFGDEELQSGLSKVSVEGGEPENLLTGNGTMDLFSFLVTGHTAYGYQGPSVQLYDGYVYLLAAEKSSVRVYRASLLTGELEGITPEKRCVHGFSVAGGQLACVTGSMEQIAELYLTDLSTKVERQASRHNRWMDEVCMEHPQELTVSSQDGEVEIHGWVLKPEGYVEGEKYPAVLDIHGGPECCYPFDWWFEFQYLAARGMAVVWCDPRGSLSYGDKYKAGAWDGRAYSDLLTFLDGAVQLGFIDPERCGCTGGSYGGYMTNYIIGHTQRFAAAVTQRSLCNRVTSYGTGDMGSILETPFRGVYRSLMNRMNQGTSTTIKTIDQVNTPLLILHATNDYRCSFEQAEQMFVAMKDRRPEVPVRFVAFPGENHGLTREGNMYAQRGHLREMADWFCRYLAEQKEGK